MKKDTSLPVGGRVSFLSALFRSAAGLLFAKCLSQSFGQLVRTRCRSFTTSGSFQALDDFVCIHSFNKAADSGCVTGTSAYVFYVSNFISVKLYVNETRTDSGWFVIHIYYLLIMFLHVFT